MSHVTHCVTVQCLTGRHYAGHAEGHCGHVQALPHARHRPVEEVLGEREYNCAFTHMLQSVCFVALLQACRIAIHSLFLAHCLLT